MDITQCQYSMFSKDQFDKNVNSCMSDWITLALSPMGKIFACLESFVQALKKIASFSWKGNLEYIDVGTSQET